MLTRSSFSLSVPIRWAVGGCVFGAMFPLGALAFDMFYLRSENHTVGELLSGNALHYIILLAPAVLGLTFYFIGLAQSKLHDSITKLSATEREQWHLANHDALTGLGNRLKMMSDMARARNSGSNCPIILIDLDRFKRINDTYGHEIGDGVLCRFSQILRKAMPEGAGLYRLGGDEFMLLFPVGSKQQDACEVAQKLIGLLRAPATVKNVHLQIGLSMGIASVNVGDQQSSDAIQRADMALYNAKSEMRSNYVQFNEAMSERADETKQIQVDLDKAIIQEALFVEYQPVHHGRTRRLKGCEALLRWTHPTLGKIPPSKFIAVAEETGQILQLGNYVLRHACGTAAHWPEELSISVNISVLHFQHPDFFEEVMDILLLTGLPPGRLVLEITETLLIEDNGDVLNRIKAFRDTGIRVSLDDFGDGFTSVKHLLTLGLDELKIDMSLTRGIDQCPKAREVIVGIVTICKAIGLTTVIEGVERISELSAARDLGVDFVQGYYFSRPLDADSFLDYHYAHCEVERLSA